MHRRLLSKELLQLTADAIEQWSDLEGGGCLGPWLVYVGQIELHNRLAFKKSLHLLRPKAHLVQLYQHFTVTNGNWVAVQWSAKLILLEKLHLPYWRWFGLEGQADSCSPAKCWQHFQQSAGKLLAFKSTKVSSFPRSFHASGEEPWIDTSCVGDTVLKIASVSQGLYSTIPLFLVHLFKVPLVVLIAMVDKHWDRPFIGGQSLRNTGYRYTVDI